MSIGLTKSLQALSDPTRRKILEMLVERDRSAGEIAAAFDISAPSVSHHLNVLKNAGLITARRNGQHIVYTLNATVVQELLQTLLKLFKVGEDHHE
jgi:ArsR family transcriptional regulator, arsenate/arsenite/antimonite-responsive transcriptional repressor